MRAKTKNGGGTQDSFSLLACNDIILLAQVNNVRSQWRGGGGGGDGRDPSSISVKIF